MRTFDVTVEREGRWWVFTIPELDAVGQARHLAEVEKEAAGVAAAWENIDPETVTVRVAIAGQEDALAEWERAREAEDRAREAQAAAAEARRHVVKQLRSGGLSATDTSRILGITKQRVNQLEHA